MIASVLLGAVAVVLALPVLSDLLSALRRRAGAETAKPGSEPRLLFLVPAHNEELLIGACVRSLVAMSYPRERMRVVVIADNSDDRTAAITVDEGAECLERIDPVLRGKPRAIEWALQRLPYQEFDAVVIVDADTIMEPGFARALAARGPLAGKAVQAYNGVSNPDENDLTRMSAVFAAARYRYAFPLKQRAGLNVPLSNGMCIGRDVLRKYGWQAFSICEDWELYAQYTAWGVAIEVAPDAMLYSQETRSLEQSTTQRTRWAAGKITVLMREAGAILRSRKASVHQKVDAMAELTALGPAVHAGVVVLLLAFIYLWPGFEARPLVAAVLLAGVARIGIYTVLAIRSDPSPWRQLRSFLHLPIYTGWRLVVQLRALNMVGEKPWVRTDRHA
jgi:1,2-diacylglycerol 3-beta-glucosyltransferase